MLVVIGMCGHLESPSCQRVHNFLLGAAIALTVCAAITKHTIDPRCAYRLGWEARKRYDASHTADVTHLESQRRA